MGFHEIRFPDNISRGARGGPGRRTQIVELASGAEERNSPWADSRRRYDAAYGVRRADDLAAVIAFFEARMAQLHGFRWKDWADYKSCLPSATPAPEDQIIGIGDGFTAQFQLIKLYASGAQSYSRPIRKPVSGTVRVALDGLEVTEGWAVDPTTGIVDFTPPGPSIELDFENDSYFAHTPGIPGPGVVVTAGFEFDVPVRFDADRLDVTMDIERLGSITSIPLVELKV